LGSKDGNFIMAVLSEEQTMLRDMAREWTKKASPLSAVRKIRAAGDPRGFDPATFAAMAEMGWAGIIIPEAFGGSDFGWLSLGLVLEETGKTLTASPLAASALAAAALAMGDSEAAKAAWLPRLATADAIGTLAIDEGPRHDPAAIATTATRTDTGWTISGSKAFVHEAHGADLFIVAARDSDGVALFAVPANAAGVTLSTRKLTDSRSHAQLTLADVAVAGDARIGGASVCEAVLDRARIMAAAEMLGMAEHSFQITLDYLKQRVQFGQILATFQALQHRMAALYTQIELLRSAVEAALAALDGGGDVPALASLAKATANDVLHLVSREVIQLHGGIGMTDEYDIGFYIKRARVLENAWGSASFHRERYAQLAGY
jgi:alkylation response protein AidB-like acyl-CoA dehydrogenase